MRRALMALVRDCAEREKLEYYHVSRACGFSEPRSWSLLYGPIEQWNSETLIDVLARFGYTLELVVKEQRRVKIWTSCAKYEEEGADLVPRDRRIRR